MRTKLLAAAVLCFVAALHAREVRVSDPLLGTPPGTRSLPAIQRGGEGYLVAWVDERANGPMLFAARLDDAGVSLDRSGIELGDAMYSGQTRPQIIWNGAGWLVFWSNRVGQLVMARVAPDGTHGTAEVIAQRGYGDWRGRSVATNGRVILITWPGVWEDPELIGTHVTVLSMNGDRISDRRVDSHASTAGMVLERDGEFVVAWNNIPAEGGELLALRIDGSGGAILDLAPHVLGKSYPGELARNGDGFVVVLQEWIADRWIVNSYAVSRDLTIASEPAPVAVNAQAGRTLVQDGASAVLVANDGWKFTALRFDDAGHATNAATILESVQPVGDIALLRTNAGFAASWIVLDAGRPPRLVSALLDSAFGALTPQRAVSETAAPQTASAIAAGASEMLVGWIESGLHLAQFGYDGARLGDEIVLADINGSYPRPVSLLFDGERYVVAYLQPSEIVIRFIAPRGGLVADSVRIPVGYEAGRVTLAKGRSSTIVLWRSSAGVVAAALSGTHLELQPRVIASGTVGGQIAAAWNGESFVVAWTEGFLDWDVYLYNRVMGTLVGEDLTAGERKLLTPISSSRSPSLDLVARGSTAFLAVESYPNVAVVRIAKDGNVAAPATLIPGFAPRLAADGDEVQLAWTTLDRLSLRAAPLTAAGTLKDEGFTFPNLYAPDWSGAVARKGSAVIVAYSRLVPEVGVMPRVFLSLLDATPNPGRRRSVR